MRISYVRGSEEDDAKFWLSRVGWEPSEVAERIVHENSWLDRISMHTHKINDDLFTLGIRIQ